MKQFFSLLAVAALIAISNPARADDYVLMKINKEDVTTAEFKQALESQFPEGQAPAVDSLKPDQRDALLRGIMIQHLLLAEVDKSGIEKTDMVQKQLAEIKKMVLVKAFLNQKSSDLITDADLKTAYDEMVATSRDEKEARARHILVPTEKEAKEAKKKLDDGKSFEDIAKEYSKDPGSAQQGGDLGYFTKGKMVKEFADAAFALKKGEVSEPVKSAFGFHIIKLEDIRKVSAPTFNEVKENLRSTLQEKKLADYVQGLIKSADVKVFDAKGKETKFSKQAPDEKKKPDDKADKK
jgi:peptidyl-prolyl cis-trans isomerase C